jgi:hypothetical protein
LNPKRFQVRNKIYMIKIKVKNSIHLIIRKVIQKHKAYSNTKRISNKVERKMLNKWGLDLI